MFLLDGLCSIVFGALTFVWPGITLWILIVVYGVYCILDGAIALSLSRARHESERPGSRYGFFNQGAGPRASEMSAVFRKDRLHVS